MGNFNFIIGKKGKSEQSPWEFLFIIRLYIFQNESDPSFKDSHNYFLTQFF